MIKTKYLCSKTYFYISNKFKRSKYKHDGVAN